MPYSRDQFYAENIPIWLEEGREEGREAGRKEGVLIGEIQLLQKFTKQLLCPPEKLKKLTLTELQELRQNSRSNLPR